MNSDSLNHGRAVHRAHGAVFVKGNSVQCDDA